MLALLRFRVIGFAALSDKHKTSLFLNMSGYVSTGSFDVNHSSAEEKSNTLSPTAHCFPSLTPNFPPSGTSKYILICM